MPRIHVRRILVTLALIALLALLAKLHASACTGGTPEWRSLTAPASE